MSCRYNLVNYNRDNIYRKTEICQPLFASGFVGLFAFWYFSTSSIFFRVCVCVCVCVFVSFRGGELVDGAILVNYMFFLGIVC